MAPELLAAFVNTLRISRQHPEGQDGLASPADLERWWQEQTSSTAPLDADEHDLAVARTLREGVRGMLAAHNDAEVAGDAEAITQLEGVLGSLPLRASTGEAVVGPATDRPATAALATIAGALVVARAAGTWDRMKICRDPQCREAFLDTTKNRSRTWCSMQVCGARAKQRTFSAKHA